MAIRWWILSDYLTAPSTLAWPEQHQKGLVYVEFREKPCSLPILPPWAGVYNQATNKRSVRQVKTSYLLIDSQTSCDGLFFFSTLGFLPLMNSRDPIMNDAKFSLRFGNPIQVIHDSKPPPAASFPMQHVSSYVPSETKDTHDSKVGPTSAPPPHPISHSNMTRDAASFADFYHSKEGRVDEVDHE